MEISRFLSKVIGLYLVIISCVMALNLQQFTTNIDELVNNQSLMFLAGFFTLILGILVIVGHNVWEASWRVIITIIGWLTLCKSLIILFDPAVMVKLTVWFLQGSVVGYTTAGLELILGGILCYYGFCNNTNNKAKRKTK